MSSANAHHAPTPAGGFGRFHFHPSIQKGLVTAGFESPRPIQADTIPACLEGRDVMGLAQTGTGKTAAFALPILQRLLEEPGRGPLVLILAPTRELALQIQAEIDLLAREVDVETVALIGGVPMGKQLRALERDPEIVVGCPGRVLDLIGQGKLDCDGIDTLVLDEADHMFDMGFLPDLRRILKVLPEARQNLLFSATMPGPIRKLANDLLDDPHVVELAPSAPAESIDHGLYEIGDSQKRGLLDALLAGDDCGTAIVFTRTKHRAKRLAQQLERAGRKAIALQGNMSQGQRERAMGGFREGRFDVLVATDIAARGIDVAGVDYVINFDVPNTPETYTHRIGRTGRSDAAGRAVTFVTGEDRGWVRDTERMLGEKLARFEVPEIEVERGHAERGARGGRPNAERRPRGGRGASEPKSRRRGRGRSNARNERDPGTRGASAVLAGDRSEGGASRRRRRGGARSGVTAKSGGAEKSGGSPKSGARPGGRRRNRRGPSHSAPPPS